LNKSQLGGGRRATERRALNKKGKEKKRVRRSRKEIKCNANFREKENEERV